MPERRYADELTIEELEALLEARRRAQRREARFHPVQMAPRQGGLDRAMMALRRVFRAVDLSRLRERVLLVVEVAALVGLVAILVGSLADLRLLNQEVVQARENVPPTPTPPFGLTILPGSSSPPVSWSNIPAPYRDLVKPLTPVPLPTPGPQATTRIVIPAIGVDAPVVEGDSWEELKMGVGHRPGSASPGQRGNMVLSGHNDVFGEVFRRLQDLELEDEVILYAGDQSFRYVVKSKRVVEPTEVSVMAPSREPIVTLITCYPYLIDTHRLVVIAQLAD